MTNDNTQQRAYNFAESDPKRVVIAVEDEDWQRPAVVTRRQITEEPLRPQLAAPRSSEPRIFMLPEMLKHSERYQESDEEGSPNGLFDGLPVIGGFSGIAGGVYLTSHFDEVVYIDQQCSFLSATYTDLTMRYVQRYEAQRPLEQLLCPLIVTIVKEKLGAVREELGLFLESVGINALEKINFGAFVEAKIGAARHHVLLAAYLMERLIQRELLRGRVFVDNGLYSEEYDVDKKCSPSVTFYGDTGFRYSYKPQLEVPQRIYQSLHPFID